MLFLFVTTYKLYRLARRVRLHGLAVPAAKLSLLLLLLVKKRAAKKGAWLIVGFQEPHDELVAYIALFNRKARGVVEGTTGKARGKHRRPSFWSRLRNLRHS